MEIIRIPQKVITGFFLRKFYSQNHVITRCQLKVELFKIHLFVYFFERRLLKTNIFKLTCKNIGWLEKWKHKISTYA